MKLAAKLILLFLAGLLLIVLFFAWESLRQQKELSIAQHQRYAAELAEAMARDDALLDCFAASASKPTPRLRVRRVEMTSRTGVDQPTIPQDQLTITSEMITIAMDNGVGAEHLYTYVPVTQSNASGDLQSRIEVSLPDAEAPRRLRYVLMSSLLTLLGVTGLSGFVIYFGGVRMVGRPLERLTQKVEQVSNGQFSPDVVIQSNDELSQLGTAINLMCTRLQHQHQQLQQETSKRIEAVEQLRHADRLRTVGRIAAGIAHEIGTPLNVVSGHAELIAAGELSDDQIQRSAKSIKSESDRIAKIISGLLDFSRQRPGTQTRTDLRVTAKDTIELLRPIAKRHHVNISLDTDDDAVWAMVDENQMQQVLTNLLNNAFQSRTQVDAAGEGLFVKVNVTNRKKGDQYFAVIEVSDNGDGISQEAQQEIFDPFFTTKEVGQGTGLGLAISHGIVSDHHGEICCESEVGKGTAIQIWLPVSADERETRERFRED